MGNLRTVGVPGGRGRANWEEAPGHFLGGWTLLYLDRPLDCMGICIYQNSLKISIFLQRKVILKGWKEGVSECPPFNFYACASMSKVRLCQTGSTGIPRGRRGSFGGCRYRSLNKLI